MRAPTACKRELVRRINILGVMHMVIGVICVSFGFASLAVHRSVDFSKAWSTVDKDPDSKDVRDHEHLRYVMMGLDIASVFCSLWFINVGCQPFVCCTSDVIPFRITWARLKVRFMVLNILTAVIFAPLIVGSATANYFIRASDKRELIALTSMFILFSVIEFLLAIFSASFSCCSRWKFDDDNDRCTCGDDCDCSLRGHEKIIPSVCSGSTCSKSEYRVDSPSCQDIPPQYQDAKDLPIYRLY